nr:hypothetical protein CFP56_52422 [Quercus suber]
MGAMVVPELEKCRVKVVRRCALAVLSGDATEAEARRRGEIWEDSLTTSLCSAQGDFGRDTELEVLVRLQTLRFHHPATTRTGVLELLRMVKPHRKAESSSSTSPRSEIPRRA